LGTLAFEERRPADAERLARAALTALAGQSTPDLEARAQALLARVELAAGADASEPLTALRRLADVSQNPRLRVAWALVATAAAGDAPAARAEAHAALGRALELARKRGLAVATLDLRLAAAELARRSGDRARATALAEDVAREARPRGLLLEARRAEALGAARQGS
jgi:hypothetical protein